MTTSSTTSLLQAARRLVGFCIEAARAYGRPDLAERLTRTASRLDSPETTLCVVGEFKQGKSSLINALLGSPICPVDDDLATAAVTVVRQGPELAVTVKRREGSGTVTDAIPAEAIDDYVSERGNPGNVRQVQAVEIALPHPLLERGTTLVDTPGVGGLSRAHAVATLGFLPAADVLLFVTDASAELSGPEVEFLGQARDLCPTVVMVLTKIDLYPEWRRIAALDRDHLQRLGLAIPIVPVSSAVRSAAFSRVDAGLNQESGIPALLDLLQEDVLDKAEAIGVQNALHDLRSVAGQLRSTFQAEFEGLQNPERMQAAIDQLNVTRERLDHLRGPGSRWSTVMNDGFAELSSEADYQFRSTLRRLTRDVEEAIEQSDPASTWPRTSEQLKVDVAQAVNAIFATLTEGAASIDARIVTLLREEDLDLPGLRSADLGLNVADLWVARELTRSGKGEQANAGLGAVRGGYGGIMMLSFLTNIVGFSLLGPATLGIGLAFGGKQIFDDRKRQATTRRQNARTLARQFLDDVQFEVAVRIRDTTRDLQLQVRDRFSERITELLRTYAASGDALQRALKQDEATRNARLQVIKEQVDWLDGLLRQAAELGRQA